MKCLATFVYAAPLATTAVTPVMAASQSDTAKTAVLQGLEDELRAVAVYAATLKPYVMDAPANGYLTKDKPPQALSATLQERCKIGVAAEIENARLFDEDLLPAVARYPDIIRVFTTLRDASINSTRRRSSAVRRGMAGGNARARAKVMAMTDPTAAPSSHSIRS